MTPSMTTLSITINKVLHPANTTLLNGIQFSVVMLSFVFSKCRL
jgi:hypothetical protein